MRHALRTILAVVVLLGAAQAYAQNTRSQNAAPKTWTANGVKMQHRTTVMHGNIIDWERRATRKDGTTSINGKTWGNRVKGTEHVETDGTRVEKLTVTAPSGEVRKVLTREGKNGTVRKSIQMGDGTSRKITTWTLKNGVKMTDTRDFDANGKLVKRVRNAGK